MPTTPHRDTAEDPLQRRSNATAQCRVRSGPPLHWGHYRAKLRSTSGSSAAAPPSRKDSRNDGEDKKPRRRSFKESKELALLDEQLPELETKRAALEQELTGEGAEVARLSIELAELINSIEQAEERWLELSELRP